MTSFFEGWYFKHQNATETIAFIPGMSNDSAFIQIITNEKSYNINYDLKKFSKGSMVVVDTNTFSLKGISINIKNYDISIEGILTYKNITPVKSDVMGPFKYFPMECRHGVLSLYHELKGYISLNKRYINFDGGIGYI